METIEIHVETYWGEVFQHAPVKKVGLHGALTHVFIAYLRNVKYCGMCVRTLPVVSGQGLWAQINTIPVNFPGKDCRSLSHKSHSLHPLCISFSIPHSLPTLPPLFIH